jgi:putative ABC transport system ATP-binding protein
MSTPAPAQLAVKTTGIEKIFGRGESAVPALKGIDFEAYCGEMIMIVGPSGCGKTTFLSVLCGTMRADAGNVEVFGTNLTQLSPARLTAYRGKNVGFIFQQFNLIPTWTITENASVPLLLNGGRTGTAEKEASRLLTEVGLGTRLKAFPRQLSGGQQQRVAIARALVHQPRLLICDEPTASLDAASGRKVMELLKASACRPDRCVIVVTHDSRIFEFADRIAEMEDGQMKALYGKGEYKAHYL